MTDPLPPKRVSFWALCCVLDELTKTEAFRAAIGGAVGTAADTPWFPRLVTVGSDEDPGGDPLERRSGVAETSSPLFRGALARVVGVFPVLGTPKIMKTTRTAKQSKAAILKDLFMV